MMASLGGRARELKWRLVRLKVWRCKGVYQHPLRLLRPKRCPKLRQPLTRLELGWGVVRLQNLTNVHESHNQ